MVIAATLDRRVWRRLTGYQALGAGGLAAA